MVDNTMLMDLMDAYLTECEIRKLAPKTIEGYKKLLRAMLLWLSDNEQVERLSDLTPMHYKRYLLHKEKDGASPQYINDILRVMRTFSRFLYDEGYTPKLLTEKIKNVKQPKVKIVSFTEEEIQGMLNYYKGNSFLEVRNRAMIAMFFDTGIRCDELISMQPEQVQSGFIIINGKGAKQRVVPLSPILAKALLKYDQTKKRYFRKKLPAPNLFLSKNGRRLSNEAIRLVLIEAAKAVGVRNTVRVSPHTCRHTAISPYLNGGSQEMKMRAGTENIAGIVGMAAALSKRCSSTKHSTNHLFALTERFRSRLAAAGVDYVLNGSTNRLPGHISISFKNVIGEQLLRI